MKIVKRFEDISVELIPDKKHEFLLSTEQIALGYDVSPVTIRRHKHNRDDELLEEKHWVVQKMNTLGGMQEATFWTKRGIIRLGFFIKSERAKKFRDWIEDLVLEEIEQKLSPAEYLLEQAKRLVQLEKQGIVLGFRVEKNTQEITEIKMRLLPEAKITEEQASNIKEGVSTIAYMLNQNNPPFGRVWGILKQEFSFAMYRELPQMKYQPIVDYLNNWAQRLTQT